MIKGYAINEKRLEVLNKTIDIQSRMLATAYKLDEKELLDVIEAYQNALSLLDDYDRSGHKLWIIFFSIIRKNRI